MVEADHYLIVLLFYIDGNMVWGRCSTKRIYR